MFRLALYQPEIAANLGSSIRVAACFGAELHVIEPCGFPWRDRDIGRVAMDYQTPLVRHRDWASFASDVEGRRILLTTKGDQALGDFDFVEGDTILLGQESAGVPDEIHKAVEERLRIPLAPTARSLNVSIAGAIALAEGTKQLRYFR